MPLTRARVIGRMREAFRAGISSSRFISDMKVVGLSYRRTTMLSDWRTVNELERKEGVMRFVRRDRVPSKQVIAWVEWGLSAEFMYKVKVFSQVSPGEPITERFINIMQDAPITPARAEALAWEMIKTQSPKKVSEIVRLQPWSAIQGVVV